MTISSATYVTSATYLRGLETLFSDVSTWAGDATQAVKDKMAQINEAWYGTYPEEHGAQASAYLDQMAPLTGCCTSVAGTIGAWAGVAETTAEDVARDEHTLESLSGSLAADAEIDETIRQAHNRNIAAAEAWHQTCRTKADELAGAITQARACATAIAVPVDQRYVAPGGNYDVVTIALVHMTGVTLEWLDPSGQLQERAEQAYDMLVNGQHGDLLYTVIETANEGNILDSDDRLTENDLEAATNPESVRGLLLAWGRATNTEFSDEDLAAVTATIVATAWMLLGSDRNEWKELDDTLEPETDLEALLTDQAIEAFTEAGSGDLLGRDGEMPTDPAEVLIWAGGGTDDFPSSPADAVADANLDLYVNGPASLEPSWIDGWDTPGDIFRNVVFDWEAVVGDDASVGGGSLQILGVLPIGKGVRVLRALRFGDEAAALSDETAAALDEFAELGDEAVAGLDSGTIDQIASLGDDVPARSYNVDRQDFDPLFETQTVSDTATAVTGQEQVQRVLDESTIFDEAGVEPWSMEHTFEVINTPVSQLSETDGLILQQLRDEVPMPAPGDVLQRVVPESQGELMLSNVDGAQTTTMRGFVVSANDAAQFGTPAEMVEGLGLQYVDDSGTLAFSPDDQVVTAIRFPATTDVLARTEVPRVADLGGSSLYDNHGWPFTGNGFTSSPDAIVPELRITDSVGIPEGSEMWSFSSDGQQVLVGVFNENRWVRVES